MLALSPLADDPSTAGLYREAQAFRRLFGSGGLVRPDRTVVFSTVEPLAAPLLPAPCPAGRSAIDEVVRTGTPAVGDLVADPASGELLRVGIAVPAMRSGQTAFVLNWPHRALLRPLPRADHAAQGVALGCATAAASSSRIGAWRHHRRADPHRRARAGAWSVAPVRLRSETQWPRWRGSRRARAGGARRHAGQVLGGIWAGRRLAGIINLAGRRQRPAQVAGGHHRGRGPRARCCIAATRRARRGRAAAPVTATHDTAASSNARRSRCRRARRCCRGVVDSASRGIVTADAAQVIVMVTRRRRMFRCPAPRLVRLPVASLLPERYRHGHTDLVRRFGGGDDRTSAHAPGRDAIARADRGGVHRRGQHLARASSTAAKLYTAIVRDITEAPPCGGRGAGSKRRSSRRSTGRHERRRDDRRRPGRIVEFNDACVRFHRFGDREGVRSALDEQPI